MRIFLTGLKKTLKSNHEKNLQNLKEIDEEKGKNDRIDTKIIRMRKRVSNIFKCAQGFFNIQRLYFWERGGVIKPLEKIKKDQTRKAKHDKQSTESN